jgi:hypothetical protein
MAPMSPFKLSTFFCFTSIFYAFIFLTGEQACYCFIWRDISLIAAFPVALAETLAAVGDVATAADEIDEP